MIRMMNVCLMAAMFLWFYDAMSPILPFGFVVGGIHAAIDNLYAVANTKNNVSVEAMPTGPFILYCVYIKDILKVIGLLNGIETCHYGICAFKVVVQFPFEQD